MEKFAKAKNKDFSDIFTTPSFSLLDINEDFDQTKKLIAVYQNMCSFDWEEDSLKSKRAFIKLNENFNPNSYWFYIALNYFYAIKTEKFESLQIFPNLEIVEEKAEESQDLLIESQAINYNQGNPQIDKLIEEDTNYLKELVLINSEIKEEVLNSLKENNKYNFMKDHSEESYEADIIKRIMFFESSHLQNLRNKLENDHQKEIEKKLKKQKISSFEDEMAQSKNNDSVCQICNIGDSFDPNIIVYCSSCDIGVHQICYGVTVIPDGDWICDVCLIFGYEEARKVECLFCPVQGGALKPTNLRIDSEFSNEIHKFKKSVKESNHCFSSENEFVTKGEMLSNQTVYSEIQQIITTQTESPLDSRQSMKSSESNKEIEKDINKDIVDSINSASKNGNFKKIQKAKNSMWVHVSCANSLNNCSFKDNSKKNEININTTNFEFSKFSEKCDICEKDYQGVLIKCREASCNLKFHAECARINKFHFDINSIEGSKKGFFCIAHQPKNLIQKIESARFKVVENVNNFSSILMQCLTLVDKNSKRKSKELKIKRAKEKAKIQVKHKKKLVIKDKNNPEKRKTKRLIRVGKSKFQQKKIFLTFRGTKGEASDTKKLTQNKQHSLNANVKIVDSQTLTISKSILKNIIRIAAIKKKKEFEKLKKKVKLVLERPTELSSIDASEINPVGRIRLIKNCKKVKNTFLKRKREKSENKKIEEEKKFCYCQGKENEQMIECSGGKNCVNNNWIHILCDVFINCLDKVIYTDPKYKYFCKNCHEIELERKLNENLDCLQEELVVEINDKEYNENDFLLLDY